jgi:FixJ family two-component response regulator
MSGPATVHVVDDDASFLRALSGMLRAVGFNVRSFASAAELLAQSGPESRGCVVTDLSMPDMDGLELQAALRKIGAVLPVVFLTGRGDIPSSVHAMRGGAIDFLEKHATQEELLAAIRRALEDDAAHYDARSRQTELRQRFAKLTPREREVLLHVVNGRMNKQIAASLGINERTVKLHRTSITTKVGVHSAAQLATLASDARLFESGEVRGAHA